MPRKIIAISILLAASWCGVASASTAELAERLKEITANVTANGGIGVVSLEKREMLFSKNAETPLNPASVMKILTAAVSLKYLGPDFRFSTKFYATTDGDLIVRGEGDPSMVVENVKEIAQIIKKEGVCRLRNILFDDSYFADYTQPGLTNDKSRYNSFTGALSLNYNRIIIEYSPASTVGGPATVRADAGKGILIDLNNHVKTSARGGAAYINLEPAIGENGLAFAVKGQIPIGYKSRRTELHISLPPLYFSEALKSALKEIGCAVSGGIYRSKGMRVKQLVLDYSSKPLAEIIADMNKFSNNMIAEQLVKFLGARFVGEPGTTTKGIYVMRKYLSDIGIPPTSCHIVNGSGLSYDNRMSAYQFLKIIYDMYRDKKLWLAFYDSLSIAGKDGTLKNNYRKSVLYGKLRAKTGSVSSVRSIAGVIPSADGELIAYAILLNEPENTRISHKIRDDIATSIAAFQR